MSNSTLKIIAMFSMIIDHLGAIFFPKIMFLRIIGRLAFPIFSFLLTEGFFHTKDIKKYAKRLIILFIISEIPYDLAFNNTLFYIYNQNIFLTLSLGLICVYFTDRFINEGKIYFAFMPPIAGALAAELLMADYGALGIITILIFYFLHITESKSRKAFLIVFFALCNFINFYNGEFYFNYGQVFAILALIPVYFYNGDRGMKLKMAFYGIYPVHLTLFAIIDYVKGLESF